MVILHAPRILRASLGRAQLDFHPERTLMILYRYVPAHALLGLLDGQLNIGLVPPAETTAPIDWKELDRLAGRMLEHPPCEDIARAFLETSKYVRLRGDLQVFSARFSARDDAAELWQVDGDGGRGFAVGMATEQLRRARIPNTTSALVACNQPSVVAALETLVVTWEWASLATDARPRTAVLAFVAAQMSLSPVCGKADPLHRFIVLANRVHHHPQLQLGVSADGRLEPSLTLNLGRSAIVDVVYGNACGQQRRAAGLALRQRRMNDVVVRGTLRSATAT